MCSLSCCLLLLNSVKYSCPSDIFRALCDLIPFCVQSICYTKIFLDCYYICSEQNKQLDKKVLQQFWPVASLEQDSIYLESGLNAVLYTGPLWALNVTASCDSRSLKWQKMQTGVNASNVFHPPFFMACSNVTPFINHQCIIYMHPHAHVWVYIDSVTQNALADSLTSV